MILQLVRTECFFVMHLQSADGDIASGQSTRKDVSISFGSGHKYLTDRLKLATGGAQYFDYSCSAVQTALLPFILKCREARYNNLAENVRRGFLSFPMISERLGSLCVERKFCFDRVAFPFREAMAQLLGVSTEGDNNTIALDRLHERVKMDKGKKLDRAEKLTFMTPLLSSVKRSSFHMIYDTFVRECILPLLHAEAEAAGCDTRVSNEYYYQCFPCTRVVRPGEFSIGIHSDCNYGFHPGNINFYLPLTSIWGTNSLVLESSPGVEDWHTLELDYGEVQRFHGSVCGHFTPENTTSATRVSLDFRVLPGCVYESLHDQYISEPGYYVKSQKNASGEWVREHHDQCLVEDVDWRCGFPFTNK